MIALFTRVQERLDRWAQPLVLLLLRVVYGFLLTQTGQGKLSHLERTTTFFESIAVPFPAFTARAVGLTELLGGALLILGLGTRLAGAALIGVLLGALATAHRDAFSEGLSGVAGTEPFPFLVAVVVLVAFGGGRWAVDALVVRWRSKAQAGQPSTSTP
jgi:putative oxidoreductase